MLKYITILLHTKSVSYCYYTNDIEEEMWMPRKVLKDGILFALKNNLDIRFVYPVLDLPEGYENIINSINHVDIKPSCLSHEEENIIVYSKIQDLKNNSTNKRNVILHISLNEISQAVDCIVDKSDTFNRLDLIVHDIDTATDSEIVGYKRNLGRLIPYIDKLYEEQKDIHINVLTDRIFLQNMSNCNAGVNNITLAPNGKFYICPAFYIDDFSDDVGDIYSGLNIKNRQLYHLDHAPICRMCDAYQCRRCIWLNRKTTLEVNTPSHEQCVISHIERNLSKNLLERINENEILIENKIKEIDYLDPFDKIK